MIYYVSHPGHCYTVGVVLLYHGERLRDLFRFVPYGKLHTLRLAPPGVVIWTDFDRLSGEELAAASALRDELLASRTDLAHLNDPRQSEQRFALLKRRHDQGTNDFDVRRLDEPLDGLRYPVFLRDEVGASYAPPTLLHDRSALDAAIANLPVGAMVRPMVVEFGTRPWVDGYYRKYGAYRVGETIFPQHCYAAPDWFIKYMRALRPEHSAEHRHYMANNPHAARLRPIFDAARIEFGRIDYTLLDDSIQVFEINTNPSVLADPPTLFEPYDQRPYAKSYVDALLALPLAEVRGKQNELDRRHRRQLRGLQLSLRRQRRRLALQRIRQRLVGP